MLATLRRLWPSAIAGVAGTVGLGFATNELTGDGQWWWWIVLAVSVIGLLAAAAIGRRALSESGATEGAQNAGRDAVRHVNISADNDSVAAWSIQTLNIDRSSPRGDNANP